MCADKPFTREMALSMTPEQVKRFWQERQQTRREAGMGHYTHAVNAVTGETLYTIDSK